MAGPDHRGSFLPSEEASVDRLIVEDLAYARAAFGPVA